MPITRKADARRQRRCLDRLARVVDRRSVSIFHPVLGAGRHTAVVSRTAMLGAIGALLAFVNRELDPSTDAPRLLAIVATILAALLFTEHLPAGARSSLDRLGHYPVSDNTFFLVRLTSLMRYACTVTALTTAPLAFLVAIAQGVVQALAWILAITMQAIFVALSTATLFTLAYRPRSKEWLAEGARGGRTTMLATICLALLLAPALAFDGATPATLPLWLPPTWFSAIVGTLTRSPTGLTLSLSAVGAASVPILFFAFRYAMLAQLARQREGTYSETLAPPRRMRLREGRKARVSAFAMMFPPEFRVVGTLASAHFRQQFGFRVRILAPVPFGIACVAVALLDRFDVPPIAERVDAFFALGLLHLAAFALPLSWLDVIARSRSFQAAWALASTPADSGRIVAHCATCITLQFALPLLVATAATLVVLLDSLWRGIAHAVLLGFVTHGAVAFALARRNLFPFSRPFSHLADRRAEGLIGTIVAAALAFALLPSLLALACSSVVSFIAAATLLGLSMPLLHRHVEGRARVHLQDVEFL